MIIGLTGQTGAGKTTLCDYFVQKGFVHINCDTLAREVVRKGETCLDELAEYFGKEILFESGELDRKKLASIAFSDPVKLDMLNKITHKHIKELLCTRLEQTMTQNPAPQGCIVDAPTLFEAGVDSLCDVTVAVLADENIRLSRIRKRDNLTLEQALARNKAQKDDSFFEQKCSYIIRNNATEEMFVESIKKLAVKLGIE